nr:hypothetical protein [Rhodobacter sp. NTK016B]
MKADPSNVEGARLERTLFDVFAKRCSMVLIEPRASSDTTAITAGQVIQSTLGEARPCATVYTCGRYEQKNWPLPAFGEGPQPTRRHERLMIDNG